MLIEDQTVEIEVSSLTINTYARVGLYLDESKKYNTVKVEDLPPTSKIYVLVKCDYCGKLYRNRYCRHLESQKRFGDDCCRACHCKRSKEERRKHIYNKTKALCEEQGNILRMEEEDFGTANKTKVTIECPKHGIFIRDYTWIMYHPECPKCKKAHKDIV